MFSKKTTKIDQTSPLIWLSLSKCQIGGEDFFNFSGLLRKHELWLWVRYLPCMIWHAIANWIWDVSLLFWCLIMSIHIFQAFFKKFDEYVWNFVKNTLIQNSYLNEFFIILKKIFNLVVSLFTNNDSPVSTMLADPHDKLRIVSNQVIKLGYSFVYRFAWGRSHSENQPFWDFFFAN